MGLLTWMSYLCDSFVIRTYSHLGVVESETADGGRDVLQLIIS